MKVKILVLAFQQSDLPVVVTGFDLVLSREGIGGPQVDSSFYPPSDVILL